MKSTHKFWDASRIISKDNEAAKLMINSQIHMDKIITPDRNQLTIFWDANRITSEDNDAADPDQLTNNYMDKIIKTR